MADCRTYASAANGANYYAWKYKRSRAKLHIGARSVPTWEKRFCWEVGSVPWKRVVDAEQCIHLFDRVLEWNDSAGEEAFKNAKLRYLSKINGQPCRIPLPRCDMFIDMIDWNLEIDPLLLEGIDKANSEVEEEEEKKVVKRFDKAVQLQQIKPTGWTDDYSELFDRKYEVLTGLIVGN